MFRSYAAMPYKFLPRQKRACLEPCSDVLSFPLTPNPENSKHDQQKKPGKNGKNRWRKGSKRYKKTLGSIQILARSYKHNTSRS
jgi:hypothetical protein